MAYSGRLPAVYLWSALTLSALFGCQGRYTTIEGEVDNEIPKTCCTNYAFSFRTDSLGRLKSATVLGGNLKGGEMVQGIDAMIEPGTHVRLKIPKKDMAKQSYVLHPRDIEVFE
jgi:hypothetical protein